MKLEIILSEVVNLLKEIQQQSEKLFEMIRMVPEFSLKGSGPMVGEVPKDRKGKFKIRIIGRRKRYEEGLP